MTIVKHEFKRGKLSLFIWTGAIAFMLAVSIFLYPEMRSQIDEINEMFSSMGSFSAAFGMDKISFGSVPGYYAVECGNVLGLGGAFFAALCAVGILSKEEKDKTAEFLFAHPVGRVQIITEKLIAVFVQIAALNIVVCALSAISITAIGEQVPWKEFGLLHLAYLLLQLEIASIFFGISAFLRKGSIGIGLGLAAVMYFLNIIANITESAEFLNYITPFGYCEGSNIVADGKLDTVSVAIGMVLGIAGIVAAYLKYSKKDIN